MASSFFSDFGLMWYLEELKKKEFVKFKELLKEETVQHGLKQIPWTEVKKASREELANLLMKHYEEKQAWDVTFRIFHKINRKDLCDRATRESAGHTTLYQTHVKKKYRDLCSREFFTVAHDFFDQKITEEEHDYFEQLFTIKTIKKQSRTVILKGVQGIGKTTMLMKLLLAWSTGSIYQNRFSYVFYFCCREVKQLVSTSLADLISREWPTSPVPTAEILSEPQKLLFLIDSFEVLSCDLTQAESELGSDCMEERPVRVLLSSLLWKKMLPDSSLIVAVTSENAGSLEEQLENPEVKKLVGFSESNRKLYVRCMFPDRSQGMAAFSFVREKEQLFTMCQIPLLCWVVGTCLKQEMERGKDLADTCRCTTSLYTSFIFNLFTPKGASCPTKESQNQLKGLCSLAAEGMWTGTQMFNKEDLKRNGILDSDIPALLDTKVLRRRESENCYVFLHISIQEFCAALFYLLRSHLDHPHKAVENTTLLLFTFLKREKEHWLFLGCFIFGLLHKQEQEKMDIFFGFQMCQEIKQQLFQCLDAIGESRDLQQEIDQLTLFYCLHEIQDEAFVQQVMAYQREIKLVIKDNVDLIVSAYCLKFCTTLRKLSLSVEDVLQGNEKQRPVPAFKLNCWHQICSVLLTNNVQVLQVKDSKLDESAFIILYNQLKQPKCPLRSLKVNNITFFCESQLFFEVFLSNTNLKRLNLNHTTLSREDVQLLCDVLLHPECNIEKLLLTNCNLSSEDCEVLASVLLSSSKLKHLNVSCNNLGKGVPSLCSALCHPDCVTELLILANCHLSETCWVSLSDTLLKNKTLSHLDISANDLKDEGLKILCEALRQPDSGIQSMRLQQCLITAKGCEDLALVLTGNQNLKSLQISNNKLEDVGVKLLCEALAHPNCRLESIGLEECELTSACCKDLASVFTVSKTLWGINLLENDLGYSGVSMLCEALKHPNCPVYVLGLRKSDFDEETQALLEAMEERIPYLTILSND
uniref:NACHT, LRR and PYD domains-containing protein 4 n=1 Tax=Jaculus jaculus TaxID=51337 RepID=UPI001E1B5147|nr:NACHT, LRR and PYD domains-containing protein 4 [Jaculus jaculus]